VNIVRNIVGFCAIAVITGCTTPSIRTAGDISAINVASISVETSGMDVAVTGRTSDVTKAQLDTDLTAALATELAQVSDPAGAKADVTVVVETLELAAPLTRVVAATSSITGIVTVTEQKTGRVIVPATHLSGNSNSLRAAGVGGLVTIQTVEKDYQGTLKGFSVTVRKALFGSETK
jgi:hypothetical protein